MTTSYLPANVTVREEWAVRSDDGNIYRVKDDSRAAAEREAALLQRGVDGEPGEPGAAPAHRYVMETPEGTAETGWRSPLHWTPPATV
ncbi:hypothetical protein E1211_17805 [Micromonospora sp. 15K316]|uniref:hypothetical protein n=1 Tax=Micromonospora sp. 15K316 TaxID=2530376 RepID=UPI001044C59D|nr:hypothetical protein [Micromonospora sp. 15K316]TDC34203.1 hypothetical protein E1211_17805 [Micromonospora sp. 15K316]